MSDFMSGEFVAARRHLEQGLDLASSPERHTLPALHPMQVPGVHPYLECLVYLAYALWYLGYPDQALQRSHEAVHWAQVSSQPYSLALALASAAWVHQHRREASAAQELAEATMAIAAEHEFVQREAIASIRYGWTLAIQGQAQAGIGHLQQGLAAYRATGAEQMWPAYLAVLAEVHVHAGQVEDGLAALHEAMALVDARAGFFIRLSCTDGRGSCCCNKRDRLRKLSLLKPRARCGTPQQSIDIQSATRKQKPVSVGP
jgi:hypothetical protein